MEGFYLSRRIDHESHLCVAPLSDRIVALSGQDVEDASGYFLFERRGTDGATSAVEILAQVLSEDAALRVAELLKLG